MSLLRRTDRRLSGRHAAGAQGEECGVARQEAGVRPRSGLFPKLFATGLAAFTVFVLLDAFVIARVQGTVYAADFASIAQAADATSTAEAADAAEAAQAAETTQSEETAGVTRTPHAAQTTQAAEGDSATGASAEDGAAATEEGAAQSQSSDSVSSQASSASLGEATGMAYSDGNITVSISTLRAYDTDIYIADVQVSSAEYLKTAFAQNAYGRNLKESTSDMAQDNGAILAINGDYYGFRDDGYVLRNGVLYRDQAAAGTDALVVYADGTMAAVEQGSVTAAELADAGAWQVLSFGPTLIEGGEVVVGTQDEVDRAKTSNPRTAIGMISPLHYIVVVSDGRTDASAGLTLYELAQVMREAGAEFAYNLDGGGSSTLWFQGETVNNPSSGHRSGEREVSDIVYFG